ncbi:hypothetical protein D3C77_481700 [compost metagenome]
MDLIEPRLQVLRLYFIQLLPLTSYRTGDTQKNQQFLTQAADSPGPLSSNTTLEPGMLTLCINRDNTPENLQ